MKPTKSRTLLLAALLASACLPLGAHARVAQNSRLGLEARETPLHRGFAASNSLIAPGLAASLSENHVRSRSTAKERDDESGLDYFLARYYASSLGRFTSVDPENAGALGGDPQSWNGYAYVTNRPLTLTDPDGRCPWCIGGAIGAAAGFLGSATVQYVTTGTVDLNRAAKAGVAGAVAGATFGLLTAPVVTTTVFAGVVETASVGIATTAAAGSASGIVGGITERALDNGGDLNAATSDPGQIVKDGVVGAVVAGGQAAVEGVVVGGSSASRQLTRDTAAVSRKIDPITGGRRSNLTGRARNARQRIPQNQAEVRAQQTAAQTGGALGAEIGGRTAACADQGEGCE